MLICILITSGIGINRTSNVQSGATAGHSLLAFVRDCDNRDEPEQNEKQRKTLIPHIPLPLRAKRVVAVPNRTARGNNTNNIKNNMEY